MGMGRGIIMIDNGGEGMDNVRPISEFLNNPKLVEKMALESDEPIYFEGEGDRKSPYGESSSRTTAGPTKSSRQQPTPHMRSIFAPESATHLTR